MNRYQPFDTTKHPFHVYLSHGQADFLLADRIHRILDHMGLRAYMYEHFPHPGKRAGDAVLDAMKDAAEVAVLLTEGGAGSAWVHQELGAAIALSKPIIPIVQTSSPQAPGFTDLDRAVVFDPQHPEVAIGHLLWLLRVDFDLFDGLVDVECPDCHRYNQIPLPPMHTVREAMDKDRLIKAGTCSACTRTLYISPYTMEPFSEQLALGRIWGE